MDPEGWHCNRPNFNSIHNAPDFSIYSEASDSRNPAGRRSGKSVNRYSAVTARRWDGRLEPSWQYARDLDFT